MSALGSDSCIGSTRPSLTVLCADGAIVSGEDIQITEQQCLTPSFLDFDILKQLHRQLDQEVIDNEFHEKVSMNTIITWLFVTLYCRSISMEYNHFLIVNVK